jgi:3-dehydroquinate synthase
MNNVYHYPNKQRKTAESVVDDSNEARAIVDSVQVQRFAVEYDYPVVFTRHAFDPVNLHLLDVLRRREPGKRHRVAVFVDGGVAQALPHLAGQIQAYFAAHTESIK